jgi:hypothetical protein
MKAIDPRVLERIVAGYKAKVAKKPASQPVVATPIPPAASQPPAPKTENLTTPEQRRKWFAHAIKTPAHLLAAHRPKTRPYKWQAETLYQLAGYDLADLAKAPFQPTDKIPLYYNLVAANGSGKDQIVIAAFATWFAMSKIRSRCIITSSSYEQLKDQTFKYIKTLCEEINEFHGRKVFEIVEFHITCNDSGSEIKCFVTDDPGKAEGRHPFEDWPGAEMAVIVNEAKSISDEMFQAFSRFTGYNYWLEISSPGTTAGHFYKRCGMAEHVWPAPIKYGEFYWRRITAYDCDHLLGKHIENLKKEYGETSLIFRSQVLAEFTSLDEAAFISSLLFENYPKLPQRTFGLPTKAGLDLALGGDKTVLYVFRNGKFYRRQSKARKEGALVAQVVSWIKEFNLEPENVNADDGGIGKPILDRLEEMGYVLRRVRNESRAQNPNFFKNRGAENWARLKRMIEDRVMPNIEYEDTITQLTSRGFSVSGIVTKLETKAEMRARGFSSPDDADALALLFDGIPFGTFKSATQTAVAEPGARYREILEIMKSRPLDQVEQLEFMNLFSLVAANRPAARETLDQGSPQQTCRYESHNYLR